MENKEQIINLASNLRDHITALRYNVGAIVNGEQINAGNLRRSKNNLMILTELRELLQDLKQNVESKIKHARHHYEHGIKCAHKLIGCRGRDEYETLPMTSYTDYDEEEYITEQFYDIRDFDNREPIFIKGKLFVWSVRVQHVRDVCADGHIYYIEPINHFAFRLGDKLFHGNVGNILHNTSPNKVRECQFGSNCKHTNCNFYHDPLLHGGSDVRNYVGGNEKMHMSYNRLEEDVGFYMNEPEKLRIFDDRIVHDMICRLALYHFSE